MSLKILLLIAAFFCCISFLFESTTKQHPTVPIAVQTTKSAIAASGMSFEKDILPILKTRCNPCHFPGGKMYERLPFDQPSTVINHADAILKRIKDSTDVQKISLFVAASKKGNKDL